MERWRLDWLSSGHKVFNKVMGRKKIPVSFGCLLCIVKFSFCKFCSQCMEEGDEGHPYVIRILKCFLSIDVERGVINRIYFLLEFCALLASLLYLHLESI